MSESLKSKRIKTYDINNKLLPYDIEEKLIKIHKLNSFPKVPSVKNKKKYEKALVNICKFQAYDQETRQLKVKKIATLLKNYMLDNKTDYSGNYNQNYSDQFIDLILMIYYNISQISNNTKYNLLRLMDNFSKYYIIYLLSIHDNYKIFLKKIIPRKLIIFLNDIDRELYNDYTRKYGKNFVQDMNIHDRFKFLIEFIQKSNFRSSDIDFFKVSKYVFDENIKFFKSDLDPLTLNFANTFSFETCSYLYHTLNR